MKPFAPKLEQPFEYDLKRVKRMIKEDDYKGLSKLISNWSEQSYHQRIAYKLNLFEKDKYIMVLQDIKINRIFDEERIDFHSL